VYAGGEAGGCWSIRVKFGCGAGEVGRAIVIMSWIYIGCRFARGPQWFLDIFGYNMEGISPTSLLLSRERGLIHYQGGY
jgi:hypothetical protein